MNNEERIYGLELHERVYSKKIGAYITKVPGGWIYEWNFQDGGVEQAMVTRPMVFVPYSKKNWAIIKRCNHHVNEKYVRGQND